MSRACTDIQSMHSRSNPDDGSESPYLPESLLEEIIVRLPLKSIFRFKCVCKSWLSRLSAPSFAQKHRSFKNFTPSWTLLCGIVYDKPKEILAQKRKRKNNKKKQEEEMLEPKVFFRPLKHGLISPTISYLYLPSRAIKIFASTNGLLLCGEPCEGRYYLCDPFIQRMLSVPRPRTWVKYQVEGLITRMDELGVVVKSCKVVQLRMFDYAKPCSFNVFCSESGTWTTYQAYAPHHPNHVGKYRDQIFSTPISLKETLYIPDNAEGVIMAYRPYADPCKLHVIHLPDRDDAEQVRDQGIYRLRRMWGTCGGCLRYHYSLNLSNRGPVHKVWERIDDREGEWHLVHSSLTGSNNYVRSSQSLLSLEYWPISFDPIDSDLMYFEKERCMYSYHMATRKLELLHRVDGHSVAGLVPYELQTWPTLISPSTWTTSKT